LWNPRLREAATTLCVSAESVVEKVVRTENGLQSDNVADKRHERKNCNLVI